MATRLDAALASNAATLAYSVSAASNRRLIVGICGEGSQTGAHTCDYGGQTGVLVGSEIAGSGTTQQTVSIFAFTDAQIAAASGTTITAGNVPTDYNIHARSYQDCEQGTLTNFDTDTSAAATPNPLAALDITTVGDDSIVFAVSGMGNAGSAAWAAPLTEQTDQPTASANGSMADDEVPTATTIACECTWTTQNRAAAVAVEIEHLSAEGITSVNPTTFDFDNTDVDINGSNFNATQGSATVYLSDAATLAGSVNEVDISSAVNTWSDILINLDFSQLSAAEVDSLHTLGPGQRYLIVLTSTPDEYGSAVLTVHRPVAFEMVLSSEFAPGTTTARLTGLTGTFGGGRIEEALNPSATNTDVASNGNREDVWNMQAKPGSREVQYDFRVLVGGIVPDTITQTPQITITGATSASGAASIAPVEAAGTATVRKTASGTPSIAPVEASGVAVVRKAATGAAVIAAVLAAGTADVFTVQSASGAASIAPVEAAGTAQVIKQASGAASIAPVEAAGTASVTNSASGDASITPIEASGAAAILKIASDGTPTLTPIEAAGTATVRKSASGAASIPAIEAAGTAASTGFTTASGNPSITPIEASGAAEITRNASGNPSITPIEAAGTAHIRRHHTASGAADVPAIEAAGAASLTGVASASGAATLPPVEAAGTAQIIKSASGSATIAPIEAAGDATIGNIASGSASIGAVQAAGQAQIIRIASGAASVPTIEAAGAADVSGNIAASGAAAIAPVEASGTAEVTRNASGAASIPAIEASGTAEIGRSSSGAATIPAISASGLASVGNFKTAFGAASVPAIQSAGTAKLTRVASGDVATPPIEASGAAQVRKIARGATAGEQVLLIEDDFNRADGPINPTITDDFNRADAPNAGADWTSHTGNRAPIVNNRLGPAAPTVPTWDNRAEAFTVDQFAQARIFGHTTATGYSYRGFHLRQDADDLGGDRLMTWVDHYPSSDELLCYFGYKTDGQAHYTGPTVTLKASDYAEGFLIRTEVTGDIVTFFIDGQQIYSTDKGSFVTGTDGIDNLIGFSAYMAEADALAIDNFEAGRLPVWLEIGMNCEGWYGPAQIENGELTQWEFSEYWAEASSIAMVHEHELPADHWAEIEVANWNPGEYNGAHWVDGRRLIGKDPNAIPQPGPDGEDCNDSSLDSGYYVYLSGDDVLDELYVDLSRWDAGGSYPHLDNFTISPIPTISGNVIVGIECEGDQIRGYIDYGEGAGREYVVSATDATNGQGNRVGWGDESYDWVETFNPYTFTRLPSNNGRITAFRAGPLGLSIPHINFAGRAKVHRAASGTAAIGAPFAQGATIVGAAYIVDTETMQGREIAVSLEARYHADIELIGREIVRHLEAKK